MSEENPTTSIPDTPVIAGTELKLPCGYFRDGKLHKDVEIVPMTGLTRKAIAREDTRNNPIKVTDIILSHCLKRIGPFTSITSRVLADLVIGDRDFLLLEIRRNSMGDGITTNIECGKCNAKVEALFKISDLEVIRAYEKEGEKPSDQDGNLTFWLDTNKFKALCRFPKGADQALIMPNATKNPIAASYGLYAACLLEWNDKKAPFDPTFFDTLSLDIIDEFEDKFMAIQPGPVMMQEASCPSCGASIDFTFRGSDFLFRVPKRGKS
jgi:hypothetical protein